MTRMVAIDTYGVNEDWTFVSDSEEEAGTYIYEGNCYLADVYREDLEIFPDLKEANNPCAVFGWHPRKRRRP